MLAACSRVDGLRIGIPIFPRFLPRVRSNDNPGKWKTAEVVRLRSGYTTALIPRIDATIPDILLERDIIVSVVRCVAAMESERFRDWLPAHAVWRGCSEHARQTCRRVRNGAGVQVVGTTFDKMAVRTVCVSSGEHPAVNHLIAFIVWRRRIFENTGLVQSPLFGDLSPEDRILETRLAPHQI